ncbi:hypothetical protein [Herbidospora sp. RD11066]
MRFHLPEPGDSRLILVNGGPDFVNWHEDDGDSHSPSHFGHVRGSD